MADRNHSAKPLSKLRARVVELIDRYKKSGEMGDAVELMCQLQSLTERDAEVAKVVKGLEASLSSDHPFVVRTRAAVLEKLRSVIAIEPDDDEVATAPTALREHVRQRFSVPGLTALLNGTMIVALEEAAKAGLTIGAADQARWSALVESICNQIDGFARSMRVESINPPRLRLVKDTGAVKSRMDDVDGAV